MTRSPGRPGSSLVEVLVALVLFASAALSTLAVHTRTTHQATSLRQRQALALTATNLLDSLRATPCAAVASGSTTRPEGSLTWATTPSFSYVAVQLRAAPIAGAPWTLFGVSPC